MVVKLRVCRYGKSLKYTLGIIAANNMKSVYVLLASRNNKSPNAFLIDQATSLDCYQCTSAEELSCGDSKVVLSSLRPANCNHVYDARYCIQSIGRYGGSYNLV